MFLLYEEGPKLLCGLGREIVGVGAYSSGHHYKSGINSIGHCAMT